MWKISVKFALFDRLYNLLVFIIFRLWLADFQMLFSCLCMCGALCILFLVWQFNTTVKLRNSYVGTFFWKIELLFRFLVCAKKNSGQSNDSHLQFTAKILFLSAELTVRLFKKTSRRTLKIEWNKNFVNAAASYFILIWLAFLSKCTQVVSRSSVSPFFLPPQ